MTIWTREPNRETFRAGALMARPTLDTFLGFDTYPIRVLPNGTVDDGGTEPLAYSPESLDHDTVAEDARAAGWDALSGFSGQQGYRGPVMHESEYVGGGLAAHIMANPGIYAVAVVTDDNSESVGWAILRKVDARDVDGESDDDPERPQWLPMGDDRPANPAAWPL